MLAVDTQLKEHTQPTGFVHAALAVVSVLSQISVDFATHQAPIEVYMCVVQWCTTSLYADWIVYHGAASLGNAGVRDRSLPR